MLSRDALNAGVSTVSVGSWLVRETGAADIVFPLNAAAPLLRAAPLLLLPPACTARFAACQHFACPLDGFAYMVGWFGSDVFSRTAHTTRLD